MVAWKQIIQNLTPFGINSQTEGLFCKSFYSCKSRFANQGVILENKAEKPTHQIGYVLPVAL
jgi:hypothetical protein